MDQSLPLTHLLAVDKCDQRCMPLSKTSQKQKPIPCDMGFVAVGGEHEPLGFICNLKYQ